MTLVPDNWTGHLQRPGIDSVPVKPGNYVTTPLGNVMEIASMPCKVDKTVMVKNIGDGAGILAEVHIKYLAAFAPSSMPI